MQMPRFRAPKSSWIYKIPVLSKDPEERSLEIESILKHIQNELVQINNNCLDILKMSVNAKQIRTLKCSSDNESKQNVVVLCKEYPLGTFTQLDVFDDTGEINPENRKYIIRYRLYSMKCIAIRNFMYEICEYLTTKKNILDEMQRVWEILRIYRKIYGSIFNTEDKQSYGEYLHPPTNILINKLFYEIVYPKFNVTVINALCDCFDEMRRNHIVTREHVRIMAMFVKICKKLMWYSYSTFYKNTGISATYSNDFEKTYMKRLALYYENVSNEWIQTCSVSEYCEQVKIAHAFEKELLEIYTPMKNPEEPIIIKKYEELGNAIIKHDFEKEYFVSDKKCKNTWNRAQNLLDSIFLVKQQTYIFTHPVGGLLSLFHAKKEKEISVICEIYSRIPSSDEEIAKIYKQYISESIQNLINIIKEPKFVYDVIAFNRECLLCIKHIFSSKQIYSKTLYDVMVKYLNSEPVIIEHIVSHLDTIIQGKGEKISEIEQESTLLQILELFKYIRDKDVFVEGYRQLLAKRLINQRSALDMERVVIGKLKSEAGIGYTSKMENMISDYQNKIDILPEFREYAKACDLPNMDFTIQLLTTGAWPTFPNIEATLPTCMNAYVKGFSEFYNIKHNHRCLKFILTGGTVSIQMGRYDIQMIPLQAIVVMAFNDTIESMTAEKIASKCGMTQEVTKYMLHSLSCGKHKLLKKIPESNTISSTDVFIANDGFVSPVLRFKMPVPNFNQPIVNREKIDEDRTYVIEAIIVRIMKSRKILMHAELVGKVIEQLSMFKPDPKIIKARIENLISREYIERDETNPGLYRYLA